MTITDIRLAELAPIPLAVVQRLVSRDALSAAVRDGCGRAFAFARAHGLTAGRNVAVYWDGAIHVDAGVEVAEPFAPADGLVPATTPGGLTASTSHFGPYGDLGAAHAAIRAWCAEHGYQLTGPNWEIYDHWQSDWAADASRIRTDVFYAVERVGGPSSG